MTALRSSKGKLLLLFGMFSLLFASLGKAQISGYLGKRAIVNTDLSMPLLMGGVSVGFEYALLRNISVTVGINTTNKQYNETVLNLPSQYGSPLSADYKSRIRSQTIFVSLRVYGSAAYAAPKGVYTYFDYQFGTATMLGHTVKDVYTSYGGVESYNTVLYDYEARNIPVYCFDIGVGNQTILFDKLVLDYGMGFAFGGYGTDKYGETIKSVGGRYGPNLMRFFVDDQLSGIGLSMHFKVGYLLF